MKTYLVYYGSDIRHMYSWKTEAETEYQAKIKFRERFGYNHLKIQKVEVV